jgi:hypothetical protein
VIAAWTVALLPEVLPNRMLKQQRFSISLRISYAEVTRAEATRCSHARCVTTRRIDTMPKTNEVAKHHLIALICAFCKQADEAFAWLNRAYAIRNDGLIFTKVEPLLKSFHNAPQFPAFLKYSTCQPEITFRL